MTPKLPTLADMVHAWTYNVAAPVKSPWLQRRFEDGALEIRIALRKARRFTLDDAFVREIVRRASTTSPDKMLQVSDLANLPFDSVFIEYSNTMRLQTQRAMGTMRHESVIEDEDRGTAGWLIERRRPEEPGLWKATYFSFADKHSYAKQDWVIGAGEYIVDLTGSRPDYRREGMTDSIVEVTSGYPWGYAVETGPNRDDFVFAATDELIRRGIGLPEQRFMGPLMQWGLHEGDDFKDGIMRLYANSMYEGRGDLRFIVTMLSMLNHVPTTYVHRPAKGHYRARLRNVPYLDNRLLTIHCGKRRILNVVDHAMKEALGARHNKRHEVRGFWRDVEYGKAQGCAHLPIERDGDYCLCERCGHLLRWIDHHERGDATLGWVRHDYNVEV